jgi:hypothetical protein
VRPWPTERAVHVGRRWAGCGAGVCGRGLVVPLRAPRRAGRLPDRGAAAARARGGSRCGSKRWGMCAARLAQWAMDGRRVTCHGMMMIHHQYDDVYDIYIYRYHIYIYIYDDMMRVTCRDFGRQMADRAMLGCGTHAARVCARMLRSAPAPRVREGGARVAEGAANERRGLLRGPAAAQLDVRRLQARLCAVARAALLVRIPVRASDRHGPRVPRCRGPTSLSARSVSARRAACVCGTHVHHVPTRAPSLCWAQWLTGRAPRVPRCAAAWTA